MKNLKEIYSEKLMTADEALELIKDGDYMFSAQADRRTGRNSVSSRAFEMYRGEEYDS